MKTLKFLFAALAVAAFLAAPAAHAASATWSASPTSALWNLGSNWAGGVAPGGTGGDVATFNTAISGGFGGSTTPIVIDSGRSVSWVSFGTSAGAYTIGGTGSNYALNLYSGGGIYTSGAGSNSEVVNAPVTIQNNTTTFNSSYTNSAYALTLGGAVSGSVAAATTLDLTGSNTGANAVTGIISKGSATTFALTKSGIGSWTLSGANTYANGTTVSNGLLTLANAGTAGTGTVTVNAGGTLTLDNSSANANRIGDAQAVSVGGNFNLIGNTAANTSETAGAFTPAGGTTVVTLTPGSGYSDLLTFASVGTRAVGNSTLYRGTGLGSALGANTSNIIFTATPTVSTGGTFAATDGAGAMGTTNAAVLHGALFDSSATGGGAGFATYDATNGIRQLNASNEQTTTYPVANANTNVLLNLTAAKAITGVTSNTLQLDNTSGTAWTVTNTGTALNPQNGLLFTGTSAITLNGGTFTQPVTTSDLVVLSSNTAGVTIGTALANNGTTASTMGVTVGGSGNITLSGGVRLAASGASSIGNQYFNVNSSGTTTLASTVSGGGLTNGAANSVVTLNTNVNAGTLKLGTGGSLGSIVVTSGGGNLGVLVVANTAPGATFDLNGIGSTISYLSGSAGGTVTNSSGTTVTLNLAGQSTSSAGGYYYTAINGSSASNITGNLNLYFGVSGQTNYNGFTQTLSGNNSYTGTTTVDVQYAAPQANNQKLNHGRPVN